MIVATVTWMDGRKETIVFASYIALGAWAEKHHGEYVGFDVRPIERRDAD